MTPDEEKPAPKQRWNRQENKVPWVLYTLIGIICFAVAWVMSGAMK